MESIFKSEAHFQKAVGDQGYPRYRTKILRVSSSIQPGHSGAPILDKTGMIVGIGDGGLHQGIARVNWAVPARDYLSALQQSTEDPQRVKPSRQDVHFSSVVDSSIDVRIGQGGAPSAGDEVLHLVWSAPIAEILDSATEEDSEDCREFLEEAQKETGHDIGEDVVDVYEDYETGATLAVPRGVALKYDPESRLLEARSPSGKIVMYVRVVNNETWEEGENAMAAYDRYLAALADWKDDPDMEDERQEEEGFRHLEKSRIALDEDGNPHSQLFANLMIDQNDFLGTAVVVKDLAGLTKEDLRIFYVMLVSVDLASFAIQ